jgi:hypothetical protein
MGWQALPVLLLLLLLLGVVGMENVQTPQQQWHRQEGVQEGR